MNLRPELSPVDGVIHGDNLALLNAASVATSMASLLAAEPIFFETGDQYILIPPSPNNSRTTILYNVAKAQLLVISQGMIAYGNVAAILTSWSQTVSPQQSANCYQAAAQIILAAVPTGVVTSWQSITLIGHSFGGATVHWLAKLMRAMITPPNYLYYYTYGSPKAEVRGGNFGYASLQPRELYQIGDPVPALPPGPEDLDNVWLLCGVPLARKWATWFHLFSQLLLEQTGEVTPFAGRVRHSDPGLIFTLSSWLSGATCFGSDNHSLASYTQYVSLIGPALVATPLPATVLDRSPPPATASHTLTAIRDTAVHTGSVTVEANMPAVVAAIQESVPTVPEARFYGRQHGRVHAIYYQGELITYARTERAQRAIVRRLNLGLAPM